MKEAKPAYVVIRPEGKKRGVGRKAIDPQFSRKQGQLRKATPSKPRSLKDKLTSAKIEGFIESTKDTVHPLKGDRVAGRGEKKLTVKTHPKTSKSTYTLSNRGTTGTNWRAGKDRIEKWVKSGDAEKNYKKTGKLFTNYSGKMKKGGRAGFQHGGRTRLLEELGRVEAEPSNRNRRAEISRVHGELNRGYKSGGAVLKGKKVGIQIK